ncbi:PREDICTED: nuclear RNA export factor 1-like isoform X1 [Ceratosolen solmsi marchali]|uniref:Nuclear RNA export factor 1-like isoform X1 n=2 Tax=Ceratosolen solmsi marchali TaxID=326594 RepID=A0AAJ7DYS3_9HYME|nr:PREDICTED: nuclear RNA export factor 1-like isoform X1 [Ceratosolen solmsi marchali]
METETNIVNQFIRPIRLTYKNPCFTQIEAEASNQINVWHKFILFNIDKEDKNIVLDNLIETCAPIFFIPVMFKMESENKATFLTICRSNTIQKLVNQKLQIKISTGKLIYYDIVLSFIACKDIELNPQQIITNVIRLCFGREPISKKSLNLENFTHNKLLGSIYCPIHISSVFDAILRFSRSVVTPNYIRDVKLPVRDLILRNNNMESIAFTEKVFGFHFSKLDVRNNKLADINLLRPFSEYKITELWLDGNPFCSKYESSKDYINAVKSLFPHLQVLDGHIIGVEQRIIPIHNKHFINDKIKLNLIKQFVEHFFTCYDQNDRIVLNGLYDTGALFSMTVGPISDNSHKQIIKYFATNRNLLKFVDYAKCAEFLLFGPEKIISALRREPPTLHKLKYLDIDLLYSTNNSFAVSVQGPFLYRKTNVSPLWFQRTLIVVAKEDNEFCIINDQYHLDNCPTNLNNVDLNELKTITDKSVPLFNPTSFSMAEKYQLLRLLQELTTMNTEFCNKFLREANWDIRQAIKTFMQTYVNNKLPSEAF